ncbi:hypothetical protein J4N42_08330 [Vibrio sp. SCSIO 43135]|uniref:hypothetical protein n=1 Tax=Vibrio sp. SCSIO 43135 TaxID=2819096 RepID=UPI00207574AB|nr:hypothetical protein [Vibrio sp. SCSIO 43135]USD40083.1 hypothetical protein J4N42_08330 [Vibrio sp. SCSIO 43135]
MKKLLLTLSIISATASANNVVPWDFVVQNSSSSPVNFSEYQEQNCWLPTAADNPTQAPPFATSVLLSYIDNQNITGCSEEEGPRYMTFDGSWLSDSFSIRLEYQPPNLCSQTLIVNGQHDFQSFQCDISNPAERLTSGIAIGSTIKLIPPEKSLERLD